MNLINTNLVSSTKLLKYGKCIFRNDNSRKIIYEYKEPNKHAYICYYRALIFGKKIVDIQRAKRFDDDIIEAIKKNG